MLMLRDTSKIVDELLTFGTDQVERWDHLFSNVAGNAVDAEITFSNVDKGRFLVVVNHDSATSSIDVKINLNTNDPITVKQFLVLDSGVDIDSLFLTNPVSPVLEVEFFLFEIAPGVV